MCVSSHRIAIIADALLRAYAAHTIRDEAVATSSLGVIFFSREEDKTVNEVDLMAALTRQMVQSSLIVSKDIVEIFRSYQTNVLPRLDLKDVETMLLGEMKRYSKIYLFIDALDECPSQARFNLLKRLSVIGYSHGRVHIIMSSRDMDVISDDISESFEEISQMKLVANNEDLQMIINDRIEGRTRLREVRKHVGHVAELTQMLVQRAEGM